jgi:hypothetical protein
MGLLDDAIREHLELKRQHGGDPSEIERQEHEAFGPGGRQTAPVEDAAEPAAADADAPETAEAPDAPPEAPEDAEDDAHVTMDPELGEAVATTEAPEAIDPPPDGAREEAEGTEEDPWLVEETADPTLEQPVAAEEDVLEETPDFLQEAPEHDRLWFEQKPPRDFDWDK